MKRTRRLNLLLAMFVVGSGFTFAAKPAAASLAFCSESCGDDCNYDCATLPDCKKSCTAQTCYDNFGRPRPYVQQCIPKF